MKKVGMVRGPVPLLDRDLAFCRKALVWCESFHPAQLDLFSEAS